MLGTGSNTFFYVEQHNRTVPHGAFHGETPDEMYFGTGTGVAATLAEQRARARQDRLASKRALACSDCELARDDHLLGSKSTGPLAPVPPLGPKGV
jgi:putative transposase